MQEIVLCGRVICPSYAERTLSPLVHLGYRGLFAVPYGAAFDHCAATIEMLGCRAERVHFGAGNSDQKNAALRILKMTHPGAWVLFIDIGETWHGGELPSLRDEADAYKVEVGPETAVRPELRLAKASACSHFVGRAAEYITMKPELVTGELPGRFGIGVAVPPQRELQRTAALLQAERENDSQEERWAFWLGETYRALGLVEYALQQYADARLSDDGWPQERYLMLLRRSSLLPALMRPPLLLRAIELLPERAEAYVELAEAYRLQSMNQLAYGVAHAAAQVARQPQEGWMLDRTVQSRADDTLAMSAASLKLFDEALFHGSMALGAQPSSERMATNLAYYRRCCDKAPDSVQNIPSATPLALI